MAVHNAREFGGRAAISYLLEKVAEPPVGRVSPVVCVQRAHGHAQGGAGSLPPSSRRK